MARLTAETIKAAIDPERFYRAALPDLKGRPGSNGWLLCACPFHSEKQPSLSVNFQHGGFRCFGCGEKGDIIGFHAKLTGQSYRDSINDLSRLYLR